MVMNSCEEPAEWTFFSTGLHLYVQWLSDLVSHEMHRYALGDSLVAQFVGNEEAPLTGFKLAMPYVHALGEACVLFTCLSL